MSKPPKTDFMALIAAEVAPAARPEEPAPLPAVVEPEPVVTLKPHERAPAPRKPAGNTLKARAHQLSVYLEPPVLPRFPPVLSGEKGALRGLNDGG
jgi:hypothetical protein